MMFRVKLAEGGKERTIMECKFWQEEKLIRFGLSRWLLRHRDPARLLQLLPGLVEKETERLKRYTLGDWKDEQADGEKPEERKNREGA